MASYQEALKLAVEEKYVESLRKLKESQNEIEQTIGDNTPYHLFLYQRMASIYQMTNEIKKVEETFI
jgi:hypothetical protein